MGGPSSSAYQGPQDGVGVDGGGTSLGAAGTLFVATFNEVLPGAGWRPAIARCRDCANVVGLVIDHVSRAPIANATVEALGVLENHPFAGTTGTNGRFSLADPEGRNCIPSGPVGFRTRADRHQTKLTDPMMLPTSGAVDITIEMDCTNVSGGLVDQVNVPVAGAAVALVDLNHDPILDSNGQPLVVMTGMNGEFVFRCVPHGTSFIWLMADPTNFHRIDVPPEGLADVLIVTQVVCGSLIGTVKDAVTLAPIVNANVAIIGRMVTRSTANGAFRIDCV